LERSYSGTHPTLPFGFGSHRAFGNLLTVRKEQEAKHMPTGIFSTYKTGENRVTSSIMAVLRSLSMVHSERLLGALIGDTSFELVHFQNQVGGDGPSVPDAEINSSRQIVIETKIRRKSVRMDQIKGHLSYLDRYHEKYSQQYLVILTPDEWAEDEYKEVDARIVCKSFRTLQDAIYDLLHDDIEVISERDQFLLRELQHMLLSEGLVGSDKDTVVVAARNAWSEYLDLSAYIFQPNRTFQDVDYIAFYTSGEIKPYVAKIKKKYDAVGFVRGKYTGRMGEIVEKGLDSKSREEGSNYRVFELSAPDDKETVHLDKAIINDAKGKGGKPTAFTQMQRYVRLKDLQKAERTSEL
jgi:hypothetical protein